MSLGVSYRSLTWVEIRLNNAIMNETYKVEAIKLYRARVLKKITCIDDKVVLHLKCRATSNRSSSVLV